MCTNPGSLVGTTVGGVYKVRRLIGSGGMGEVYAADGKSGEKVAIKVLHDKAAQDKDLVARFNREASIAATIQSPHIANILGAGKDRDGRLSIAFELLSGEGLDERLRREQYLSFAEVAPVVDDGLQGLAAAHNAGVVHRDIKPANLFIEKRRLTAREIANDEAEERTRILDFGVSKVKAPKGQRSEPSLTAFDATLGSFAYMAPEQVRGSARVDQRADLYALGAVAFRALSGRLPFEGQNALTLHRAQAESRAADPVVDDGRLLARGHREVPRPHDGARPGKRFASAEEALATWRRVCRQMGNAPRRRPKMLPVREERTDVTARSVTSISSVSKVGSRH